MSAQKFVRGVSYSTGISGATSLASLYHLTWNARNLARIDNWEALLERDLNEVMPVGEVVDLIQVRHVGYQHYMLRFGGNRYVHFHNINAVTRYGTFGFEEGFEFTGEDWDILTSGIVDESFRQRYSLCAYFNGYSIANFNCQNVVFFCWARAWASDQTLRRRTLRRWYRNNIPVDVIPRLPFATNLPMQNGFCVVMTDRLTRMLLEFLLPENLANGQEYTSFGFTLGDHQVFIQPTPAVDFRIHVDPFVSSLREVYVDNIQRSLNSVSGFILITDDHEVDQINRWTLEIAIASRITVFRSHFGLIRRATALGRSLRDAVRFNQEDPNGQSIAAAITAGCVHIGTNAQVHGIDLVVPN